MPRPLLACLTLMACLLAVTTTAAQEIRVKKKPAPKAGLDETMVYDKWWVSGIFPDGSGSLGSAFSTEGEARAHAQKWLAQNHASSPPGSSLRFAYMEIEGEASVRRKAGDAVTAAELAQLQQLFSNTSAALNTAARAQTEVNRARLALEQGQTVKNINNWGQVLAEYGDAIKQAYQNVVKLKEFTTSNTSRITKAQFDRVDGLVEQYNRYRDDLEAQRQYSKSVSDLSRAKPPTPGVSRSKADSPPASLSVEGKTGVGALGEIDGGTRFTVEFKSGGVAVMRTAEEGRSFTGSWSQSGRSISMKAGASIFEGRIEGSRVTGTRGRANAKGLKDTTDTWWLEVNDAPGH